MPTTKNQSIIFIYVFSWLDSLALISLIRVESKPNILLCFKMPNTCYRIFQTFSRLIMASKSLPQIFCISVSGKIVLVCFLGVRNPILTTQNLLPAALPSPVLRTMRLHSFKLFPGRCQITILSSRPEIKIGNFETKTKLYITHLSRKSSKFTSSL